MNNIISNQQQLKENRFDFSQSITNTKRTNDNRKCRRCCCPVYSTCCIIMSIFLGLLLLIGLAALAVGLSITNKTRVTTITTIAATIINTSTTALLSTSSISTTSTTSELFLFII